MIERGAESEPGTIGWDRDDDPSQETIRLLQEEIARLEIELQARGEPPLPPPDPASPNDAQALDEWRRRIDELRGELAERDEMVALLLEQTRLFEEAAEAQRAEWEQLNAWVSDVEHRVDRQDADGPRLLAERDAERRRADALHAAAESDRRRWDAERLGLRRELELLRDQLSRRPEEPQDHCDDAAFVALAAENRELRTAVETIRKSDEESQEIGRRLASTLVEIEQARRELRHLDDDLRRERAEHEAELSALRVRHARELLEREVNPSGPRPAEISQGRISATEADERIRAFRQHLRELHDAEVAERSSRTMAARLSRLWRKTGPT